VQLAKRYDKASCRGLPQNAAQPTQHDTATTLYTTPARTAKHRISHGDNTALIRIQRGIQHSTHTSMAWCASDEHRNPNVSAMRWHGEVESSFLQCETSVYFFTTCTSAATNPGRLMSRAGADSPHMARSCRSTTAQYVRSELLDCSATTRCSTIADPSIRSCNVWRL
jgi:hypothetical protein